MNLTARLLAMVSVRRRVIVGIAGAPGSGKSTVAARLVEELAEADPTLRPSLLPMDGFHLSNAQLERVGLRDRKGAIETFDAHGYLAMLRRIVEEPHVDVYVPDYSRVLHEPIAAGLVVPAGSRVVITEGNYLAMDVEPWNEVKDIVDELWMLRADEEVLRERLIPRHMAGGMTRAEASAWVDDVDAPNGQEIERGGLPCDLVIDN